MNLKRPRRLVWLSLLILLIACSPPSETAEGPVLEGCQLAGLIEAQCGSLALPENRADPGGRQIDVHFAVIPAQSSVAEPDPVFMLAGGPGQAATEAYPLVLDFFGALRQNRDVVLVDQRGTGQSNPLACPQVQELPLESGDAEVLEAVQACRQTLAQRADLTQYTTDVAMQDLDDVRRALGYEQINLVGTSYGSRAALRYMSLFPQNVRSAVLNAVVSPQLVLQLQAPADGQRALALLFERCREDAACRERFPDFESTFGEVRRELEGGREVTMQHPVSGERQTLDLDEEAFMGGVFTLLYSPELVALLPLMVEEIALTGDYGPLLAQMVALTADLQTYQGMFFAVVCSEDAPLLDLQVAQELREGSPFPLVAEDLLAQCENWPQAVLDDSFRQPLRSDIPTLLLSGAADPITPPHYAEQVAEGLSNSHSMTLPDHGHDVLVVGCMPTVITEFISAGAVEDLETACLQEINPPPFFVSPAGPRP